ncbi:MAG: DUF5711 family protein [Eubacteriales bacterium]|nr:DUF5711 family protein [Clostridiales bacterium]MDD2440884.1 DUF5711 family protein [Eubacteriales bacterium]MDD4139785.1 DUF5711 family protein [Eubacteriales bacterium]MDD4743644.1 DUF5711 family protein [Eubacteriales bacterium]
MMQRHNQPGKQRNRASLIVMIALAFLLMAGTAVLVSQLPEDDAWRLNTTAEPTGTPLAGFPCDAAQAQNLYPFGGNVIRLATERITSLDILGTEQYAVDIDFASPYAIVQGDWLLAADRDGPGYVMLSPEGLSFQGELAGPVRGAAVGPDGVTALIQDQQNGNGIVSVLEAGTGRHLFDCHFPESGYVLSVAFVDSAFFDVSLVNTDGSAVQPVIKRYAIQGNQTGQLVPDLTALYPFLRHTRQGNPVLAGASQLAALSFSHDGPLWTRTFQRIQALAAYEDSLFVLAAESLNASLGLYRFDASGAEKRLVDVGESATGPVLSGGMAGVASGTRLLILDSQSGELLQEENLPADIVRFAFSGPNSLIVVTNSGVSSLTVH